MGRENKNEAIAAFHRSQILKAAEKLFSEKGFDQTKIDDISRASSYSRRTIYAYYKSKDDILHHIIIQGLITLKNDIEAATTQDGDFETKYMAICHAMKKYQDECPHSFEKVGSADTSKLESSAGSEAIDQILLLGTEINELLAAFLREEKKNGILRHDAEPMISVYIIWSGITALLTLTKTKGRYISRQFSVSEDEFLDYGFRQIINSFLETRI